MDREETRGYIEDRIEPCPVTGCWLWTLCVDRQGYGKCNRARGEQFVHRLAYRAFIGPIPHGLILRHKCHVPACCNPDHLIAGTHKQNKSDQIKAGRLPEVAGEKNGRARLSETDAREILRRGHAGERGVDIARDMSLPRSIVHNCLSGKTWGHLGIPPVPRSIGERHHKATITEAQAREILARYRAGGIGHRPLAREYGVSRCTVRNLVIGKTWKHLHAE